MNSVKWGLIGCGDISRKRVAPALAAASGSELTAVARKDASLAESFAREFGVDRWYADWRDLLKDDEIEAVYIATPVYLHAEQAVAAAEAGKHVLCEKPLALDAAGCDRIIDACSAAGVTLGTAYYRHFYPLVLRVKEIIASGEIGDPVMADVQAFEWFDRRPGDPRSWLLEKDKAGGGPMMDFGCHRIEVLQHLFGTTDRIQSGIYNLQFHDREVEDTARVSLLFAGGVLGNIQVSHASFTSRDSVEILGTRGSLHIPVLNGRELIIRTEKGERREQHAPHANLHQPLIEDFLAALREGQSPAVDGRAGKEVSLVLDRINGR
ncbi:MAG: Gfo/Idh/MocA family oxidoreductase [Spirochaetales bacterium]|nr:Gfo/Idh/MocA family oxidoreductase [Spirochaetales bacterium]